jgi:hypothetical protein
VNANYVKQTQLARLSKRLSKLRFISSLENQTNSTAALIADGRKSKYFCADDICACPANAIPAGRKVKLGQPVASVRKTSYFALPCCSAGLASLLELAAELGNVSKACQVNGLQRQQFCPFLHQQDAGHGRASA